MTDGAASEQLISYLKEKVLRGRGPEIGEDTPLVSSGLVDSFALIEVLLHLEKVTNRRISARQSEPARHGHREAHAPDC